MIAVAIKQRLGGFPLDVAFEGPGDGITVLFGPSGAGKTATLSAIATGRGADAAVTLNGRILTDLAPRHRRIGRVFQDSRLFPHLTTRANLLYGYARAKGERPIALDSVVAVLDIGHLLARGVADLSGGERQRVALGRALLSQPDLLLLDEPLAALDGARKSEILGFIQRLKTDYRLPMIYVTHSPDEVRAIADHVVRIDTGRVVATGGPEIVGPARLAATILSRDVAAGTTTLVVPSADLMNGDLVEVSGEP